MDSSQSSRGEEAGCQETGRPEECLEAAWPCACGETLQVRSRLVARNSELQKVVLGIAGPRPPAAASAAGGVMSCLRLAAAGNEGKEVSHINMAQIEQRFVHSSQRLDFLL